MQLLDLIPQADFVRSVWASMNDALKTKVYCLHLPHTIAVAAISLTAKAQQLELPKDWWIVFDVEAEDMSNAVMIMQTVYKTVPLFNPGTLPFTIEGLRQILKQRRDNYLQSDRPGGDR